MIKVGRSGLTVEKYLQDRPPFVFFDEGFSKAADLLGKENVIVRVYERGRLVGGDSVSDFLHACDLPLSAMWKSNRRAHQSFSQHFDEQAPQRSENCRGIHREASLALFVRNFFNQENFSRLNKYVLLDSNMRREIMKVFTAGNDHIAEMFLTAYDADALAFHDDISKATMPDDELILTYEELVKLLVAYNSISNAASHGEEAVTGLWPQAS